MLFTLAVEMYIYIYIHMYRYIILANLCDLNYLHAVGPQVRCALGRVLGGAGYAVGPGRGWDRERGGAVYAVETLIIITYYHYIYIIFIYLYTHVLPIAYCLMLVVCLLTVY